MEPSEDRLEVLYSEFNKGIFLKRTFVYRLLSRVKIRIITYTVTSINVSFNLAWNAVGL